MIRYYRMGVRDLLHLVHSAPYISPGVRYSLFKKLLLPERPHSQSYKKLKPEMLGSGGAGREAPLSKRLPDADDIIGQLKRCTATDEISRLAGNLYTCAAKDDRFKLAFKSCCDQITKVVSDDESAEFRRLVGSAETNVNDFYKIMKYIDKFKVVMDDAHIQLLEEARALLRRSESSANRNYGISGDKRFVEFFNAHCRLPSRIWSCQLPVDGKYPLDKTSEVLIVGRLDGIQKGRIVEIKHRRAVRLADEPGLHDRLQLQMYMKLLGCQFGVLYECIYLEKEQYFYQTTDVEYDEGATAKTFKILSAIVKFAKTIEENNVLLCMFDESPEQLVAVLQKIELGVY